MKKKLNLINLNKNNNNNNNKQTKLFERKNSYFKAEIKKLETENSKLIVSISNYDLIIKKNDKDLNILKENWKSKENEK